MLPCCLAACAPAALTERRGDRETRLFTAEVEQALLKSTIALVATVCTPEEEADTGKKKKQSSFASVGAKFVKSLRELMSGLMEATAHFVRCCCCC